MDIRPDMISSSFSSSSTESIIYDCRAQLMVIVVVVAWKFFNNDNDHLNFSFSILCRRIIKRIFNQKSLKSSTHVALCHDGGAEDDEKFSPSEKPEQQCVVFGDKERVRDEHLAIIILLIIIDDIFIESCPIIFHSLFHYDC